MKSGQSKGNININCRTTRLPKALKSYGNRGTVLPLVGRVPGNSVRNLSSIAGSSSTVSTDSIKKIRKISELCANNPNFIVQDKVYNLMYDTKLYELAYKKLRSKPGSMTPGINPTTLDGMSSEVLIEITNQIREGTFKFKPGRRVNIPKANGGTRPLRMAPPRDKLVQEVMRIILEAIYEPSFSDSSHGFRPGRSCHTALKEVKSKFQSATWFIEGDISKCFDSIDHNKLVALLSVKIKDVRFIDLIRKSLNAGYMEGILYSHSLVGTPQGSIISPILCNIYMDQLDKFIENLTLEFNKGKKRSNNPVYINLQYKKRGTKTTEEKRKWHKLMLQTPSVLAADPTFRRLMYIRYADDWIIGVCGTKEDSVSILAKVRDFMREKSLTLSDTKTLITNVNNDRATFLGTNIFRTQSTTYGRRKRGFLIRDNRTLKLTAPMDRVLEKLTKAGIIMGGKPSPKFKWLANSKDEIILLYNAVYRGILQYYSFTQNFNSLSSYTHFILKSSCAKLLATKLTLGTQAAVFKKFGKNLKGRDIHGFVQVMYGVKPWGFKAQEMDPLLRINAKGISRASLDNLLCVKCGSEYRVEMHHVRMMKDLNPKVNKVDKIMAEKRRKQIPLCRKCHVEHHAK